MITISLKIYPEINSVSCGEYPSGVRGRYRETLILQIKNHKFQEYSKGDFYDFKINSPYISCSNNKISFSFNGDKKMWKIADIDRASGVITLKILGVTKINNLPCTRSNTDIKKIHNRVYTYTPSNKIPYNYTFRGERYKGEFDISFKFKKGKKLARLRVLSTQDLNLGVGCKGARLDYRSPGYKSGKIKLEGAYKAFIKIDYPDQITLKNNNSILRVNLDRKKSREKALIKNRKRSKKDGALGTNTFYIDGIVKKIPKNIQSGEYRGTINVDIFYD